MKKSTFQSVSIAFISLILVAITPATSLAATSKAATTSAVPTQTNVLKLSPVRTDLTIDPGSTAQVKTYVGNTTSATISVQPIENDFVAGPEENGTPALILSPTQYAPTHSLKRFMLPLPNVVTVPAHQVAEVTLTIAVPKTAQAGGYFGAVRFAPSNATGNKQVNLSESVASIILMTVPGPTVESIGITNFDIQQGGTTGTSFRNSKNLDLYLRFENKGNLQEAPFGQIYIQKGKKSVFTYNFNDTDPKAEILPDSARRWSIPLSGFGTFGKYTVGAVFTYGSQKQQTLDITKTIWIIPTGLIFAAIGGVVGLIVIIVLIWWFLRSYKRRIMRKSRRW